jgi:hypothetical protein
VLGAEGAEGVDVHPGREHRARAAQHDAADGGVVGRGAERGAGGVHELEVERVALLGPVEDDMADGAAVFGQDEVAHRGQRLVSGAR